MRNWVPFAAITLVIIVILLTVILSGDPENKDANGLLVSVDEGGVNVQNSQGSTNLNAGESAQVAPDGSIEKKDSSGSESENESAAPKTEATLIASSTAGQDIAYATKVALWITGYSLTDQNEPLAETVVKLFSRDNPTQSVNAAKDAGVVSVKTNDKGYYALQVPEMGRYFLYASPQGPYSNERERVRLTDETPAAEINFTHESTSLAVRGKVIDKETQEPIAGALLVLSPNPINIENAVKNKPTAESDINGQFIIEKVPEGTYNIEASAKGYQAHEPRPWRDPTDPLGNITVSEQTQAKEHIVELQPGGSVLVRVFDSEGNPLPDITIGIAMQGSDLLPRSTGRTNERGEYQNDTLPKGKGLAFARERIRDNESSTYGMTLSEMFETGTVDDPAEVEITMSKASSISGRVMNENGDPVSAILFAHNVEIRRIAMNVSLSYLYCETDGNGNYTLYGLGEGTWEVTASKREQGDVERKPNKKTIEIKGEEHLTGIDFIFGEEEEGETIEGIVKDQFDEPVTTARLYVNTRNEKGELVSSSGKTDENGHFKISGLTKAPNVQIGCFAEGYKSHNHPHKMDGSLIEITMMKGGSMEGIVIDKADQTPLAGIQVRIDFQSDPNVEEKIAVTDGSGHFKFEELQPGFYKIMAIGENYSRFERTKVELQPGEELTGQVIDMEQGVTFIGRLTGPQGEPVVGASVGLLSNRSTDLNVTHGSTIIPMPDSVSSNQEGIFQIQIPSERGDTLVIIPSNLAPKTFAVNAEMAQSEPVPIPVGNGGVVEGTVFNSQGAAQNSAKISIIDTPDRLFPYTAYTNEEGYYRIERVAAGQKDISKQGDQGSLSNETKKASVQEGETVRVDFGSGEGALIQGIVTKGGEPVPNASLVLEDRVNRNIRLFTLSNENGLYQIKGVPDGEYTLLCTTSENLNYIGTYNAEDFEELTVTEDQQEYTVNFSLKEKELLGTILDAETGEPIPGVAVNAINKDNPRVYIPETNTEPDGRFKLLLRKSGLYTIHSAKVGYNNVETEVEYSLDAGDEPLTVEIQMERADCQVEAHLVMPIQDIDPRPPIFQAIGENPPRLSYEAIPDQPYTYRITGMEEGMLDLRVRLSTRDRTFLAISDPIPVKRGETTQIFMNFFEISSINMRLITSDGSPIPAEKSAYRIEFQNFPQSSKLEISPSVSENNIQVETPLGNYPARLTVTGFKPVDFIPEAIAEMQWGQSLMQLDLRLERE